MGLGLPVERDLSQQKLNRQERRQRFSDIDGRHLAKGGLCLAPFALLSTQVLIMTRELVMCTALHRCNLTRSPIGHR